MLSDLNAEQRAAVKYLDGPLLVLAGAGSGKTRVITQKIAHLVGTCGMPARTVAAITFTNKAAREMRERVNELVGGKSVRGLTVCTFHALGLQILRREAKAIGYKPGFSILDQQDAAAMLGEILKAPDKGTIRRAQAVISNWKNALLDPERALAAARSGNECQIAHAYVSYQATLSAYQAVDFDDLIRLPSMLFRQEPEVLDAWQRRLRYLLIDEYQDTNGAQYALIRQLTGPMAAFTAVGDDDQSIYAWRGADPQNLQQLHRDYPNLHVIQLNQNYRSSLRILGGANSLIARNPRLYEKKLWSDMGPGDPVQVFAARDEADEAESVAMRISAHKFGHRTRYSDYAILYRGNHQARVFEEALRAQRIPYVLSGGQSFFERAEIRDVIGYLRLIANQDDDPAFIRAVTTPKRGVGAQSLEKLGRYAGERGQSLFAACFLPGVEAELSARQLEPLLQFCQFVNRMSFRAAREPAAQLLNELLDAIGYEAWLYDQEDERSASRKWANVLDFANWLGKKGEEEEKNLIEVTQTIALVTMLDARENDDREAVRLSTLHAAKGLEYPHVFLVGVEEGLLPHRECIDEGRVEEERRLMYVGITRARRSLTLSWCRRRKRAGEWQPCEPSRFIGEIGEKAGVGEASMSRDEGNARLAAIKAMLANRA